MTLQSQIRETHQTSPSFQASRGDSYITLPANAHGAPRTVGTYVSLPGRSAEAGSISSNRVQGHYVTLPLAFLEETEISYTRRG